MQNDPVEHVIANDVFEGTHLKTANGCGRRMRWSCENGIAPKAIAEFCGKIQCVIADAVESSRNAWNDLQDNHRKIICDSLRCEPFPGPSSRHEPWPWQFPPSGTGWKARDIDRRVAGRVRHSSAKSPPRERSEEHTSELQS